MPRAPLRTRSKLVAAFASWRTAAVALQSFPSALPLGLVLTAIPAWLALAGVDIKTIGFITLAQAPWTFKFLWSPLLDRFTPGFLGRKRGWAVLAQAALLAGMLALAWLAHTPDRLWLIAGAAVFIAFASATQDIAIDAYAVEVLRKDEQGVAAGARAAVGRVAFFLSGRVAITATKFISWPLLFAIQGLLYLPAMALMAFSPEPDAQPATPRTLREAVWEPLVAFLRQHHALQIIAFLVLYKFADNLSYALVSPFLVQAGYDQIDVGVASGTIGMVAMMAGALLGGAITTSLGLGHSLWLFGLLQAFSNIGYVLVASTAPDRALMYTAMGIEAATSGMGTGAFSVLLLRLTEKRFSATQYALLSSIFALGRTVSGPIAGVLADALGWRDFFILTIVAAAPGLVMLQLFVPLGVRDPELRLDTKPAGAPLRKRAVLARFVAGSTLGVAVCALALAALNGMRAYRAAPAAGFDLAGPLHAIVAPARVADVVSLVAVLAAGVSLGLGWAALAVGRRGLSRSP
jgi:PAT family beta-lactamase induction signal transducer AmpG